MSDIMHSVAIAETTTTDRVRARLVGIFEERRGMQAAVAARLGMTQGNVSKTLHIPGRPLTLEFLEACAEVAGVSVAELCASHDRSLYDLGTDEARIIRAMRLWPTSITRALVDFLSFFAAEEPAAGHSRNMAELWRHLDPRSRLAVYGFAVERSAGMIPRELESALFDGLSDETKAEWETQAKRRRS